MPALTPHEESAMQLLEESSQEFVRVLLESGALTQMNLGPESIKAIQFLGPLIYRAGAARVFMTYDCYSKT